jgi:quercetin dioxygenase-like cupin family protein
MRVLRSAEIQDLSVDRHEGDPLQPHWLQGPENAESLDVALISLLPGGSTPLHVHIGGQVIVGTAGRGFVEVDGERAEIAAGDVVICPPGEQHTHGALEDSHFSHLTVTTGGYRFPESSST